MDKQTTDLFGPSLNLEKPAHIYTVSQITQDIKLILENAFERIWVEGEVSNFRPNTSGHFYFSLKDENALLSAVMFSRLTGEVKFKIEDGLRVICFGKIGVYPAAGRYQIIVEKIEPKGIGSLQLAFQQLKQRLEKEGLFSAERKRPIPYLPSRIGLVTSLDGAAIKDIFKVLDRRFKDIRVIVKPVKVQGQGAKEEIARAIKDFNDYNLGALPQERIDVMIVGRGGGSIEDLWAFNEEIVARAIYDSKIPVISAVGHERDYTIADWVADLRAATPSIAAELVIPRKEDLEDSLNNLKDGLKKALSDMIVNLGDAKEELAHRLLVNTAHAWELSRNKIEAAIKKLLLLDPAALIPQHQEKITGLAKNIYIRMEHFVKLRHSQLVKSAQNLASLNPLSILSRGYSVTFGLDDGRIIRDVKSVGIGQGIKTKLHRGELISEITEVHDNG